MKDILLLSFLWAFIAFFVSYFLFQHIHTSRSIEQKFRIPSRKLKRRNIFWAGIKKMVRKTIFSPGFFISKFTDNEKTARLIFKSGFHESISLKEYLQLKQIAISILSWFIFFYVLIFGGLIKALLLELIIIFIILKIPDVFLFFRTQKRAKKVNEDLPNFIDMLSMSTETGMNFYNAFQFVGNRTKGILGDEVKKVIRKIHFGFPLDEAFDLLPKCIKSEELRRLTIAVKQAKQLGVSISETLKIQSQMIRNRRRQRAEELSKTAAVKIAIPLVFFIFPALLIIYIGPGLLRLFLS